LTNKACYAFFYKKINNIIIYLINNRSKLSKLYTYRFSWVDFK